MRRRRVYYSRAQAAAVRALQPTEAPCERCGIVYRWHGAGRTCEQCQCKAAGAVPRGTCADGTEPRLFLRQDGILQRCTECNGPALPVETLDGAGRCPFCALPGEAVYTDPTRDGTRHIVAKLDAGLLLDPRGFAVRLQGGQVPVTVLTQGLQDANPHRLVSVRAWPAWGTGWYVLDTEGREQCWRANWDSSG